MTPLKLYKCPRVGLTLKRYDLEKLKYWMADYRFLTFPHLHKKFANFIHMSMIREGEGVLQVVATCKCKRQSVEEIFEVYHSGIKDKKRRLCDYKTKDQMKTADFAYAYALH